MDDPAASLHVLAEQLREERSVITPHVGDPDELPAFGLLAAAGPRAAQAPGEYSLLIESVREGYLLHYGEPRVVVGADDDLALLAGDYLYALGLERLAGLGDLEGVRELADLISLAAQLNAGDEEEGRGQGGPHRGADELWLAAVTAVAAGASAEHERAKTALRDDRPGAPGSLWRAARQSAGQAGLDGPLERVAEAIGFTPPSPPA